MTWKTRTLIVILTLMMTLGSASLAFAQEPTDTEDPGRLARLGGEVIAVSDDGFTLKPLRRPNQRVTVVVTDDTRYRFPGVEDPSLADIEVGMFALVGGTWDDNDETFVARGVGAASRDQIRRHAIRGEVTGVDLAAGTLTVDAGEDEWTVHTTDDTRYRVPEVENPTLADVQVGARVVVAGRRDEGDDYAGTARLIAVVPKDLVKGRGRVTAIEGNTLTIETWRGDYTVVTDEDTRYRARDIEEPSLADIQVGDVILVVGFEQEEGVILARGIGILGELAPGTRPGRPDDSTP
jgi:hypothetical protein